MVGGTNINKFPLFFFFKVLLNRETGLTCFRDFLIIGWGFSSSSEKARVRGSKSRPDEAIESATRDKPYCIRDESSESVARIIDNFDVSFIRFPKTKSFIPESILRLYPYPLDNRLLLKSNLKQFFPRSYHFIFTLRQILNILNP